MNHRCLVVLATILTALVLPPRGAAGQSLWTPRDRDHTVSLEFLRPSFERVDADAMSGAFCLSGRTSISAGFSLLAEVPIARIHAVVDYFDYYPYYYFAPYSELREGSTVGNIYLGVEARAPSTPIFGEIGVRLPTVPDPYDEAIPTGLATDVTRLEAFLPKTASVVTAFDLREVTSSSIAYRFRLSPVLTIPTESGPEAELWAVYSWQVGYEGRAFRVGAGAAGRTLLTENTGNLGYRSTAELLFHADFLPGPIRPGLDLHLPLDSYGHDVPVVLGGSLSWTR